MTISMDSAGYVQINTAYDSTNISGQATAMTGILNTVKTYDPSQMTAMLSALKTVYSTSDSFDTFLNNWQDVVNEVMV